MKTIIDLFSGCGGLLEGFLQEGSYIPIASVEWKKEQIQNLRNRLLTHWNIEDVGSCIQMDIQRTNELINGWENDDEYQTSEGLDYYVNKNGGRVDIIIGGPPCQAYSVAGRIRDKNNMKDDYRNFLFESYLKIIDKYRPDFFIFENVQGILSAKPSDRFVTELISEAIEKINYSIIGDLKNTLIEMADYGIPQSRKRVIILGVNNEKFSNPKEIIEKFYSDILPKYKVKRKTTIKESIGDLNKLFPVQEYKVGNKKFSHSFDINYCIKNHEPRYHNTRDIGLFKILAEDALKEVQSYKSSESKNQLYYERTGKKTNVHKYHVLKYDDVSTTICAHLKKDGLRYIHPDIEQSRSITVREAARLQTFDDSYEFISSQGANYEMIGNAVPPKFSYILAKALKELY